MRKWDRRTFLKTAALGAVAAGAAKLSARDADAAGAPKKWDRQADVVVVGGGGAGLMAALQAGEAGASVLLIEKMKSVFSSSTSISGGLWASCLAKVHKKENIEDSPDIYSKDLFVSGSYMNYPFLVKAVAEHSGEAFDWINDRGYTNFKLEKPPGHSAKRAARSNRYTGRDYVEAFWKIFQDRKIPVEFNAPLTRLIFDPAAGRVVGVEASRDGRKFTVRARKAVILATGGFSGSAEVFDAWVPAYAGKGVLNGGGGNAGDGMKIAVRDIGAPLTHMQYTGTYPAGVEVGKRAGPFVRFYYFMPEGAILVNQQGVRYIDEMTPSTRISPALARQPNRTHYLLADRKIWDATIAKHPIGTLFGLPSWTMERVTREIEKGQNLFRDDTVEGLAKKASLPPDVLEKTVANYNEMVKTQKDAEFGRKVLPAPIESPPFSMVKLTHWTDKTMGGIRINEKLQVVNAFNEPIKGIFAAGDVVGGFHGENYLSGCGLSWAFTSGYLAGRSAAKAS